MARLGWLNRMTQFKEKAGKNRENATVGLYGYPVLMAADILAYRATLVPVGEDQKQHLELTRDIAAAFNAMFDVDCFPLPEPKIETTAARVMSLRDGSQKMSKSAESDMTRINLTDDVDMIANKIKKAKSDADVLPAEIEGLSDRAEARNLVGIYAGLAGISQEAVLTQFAGQGFGVFKPALAELATDVIAPISAEMRRLLADVAEIDNQLAKGAQRAQAIAEPILDEVKQIVGFVR